MTLRTDLITWLPQDTLAVRTLRIGYLCGLRLTKAVGFYVVILLCYCSVILSNAKVLEYRFFTVFCALLLKRFFTAFCALLLKRFFTAFRMTTKCAKHRYARAEWQQSVQSIATLAQNDNEVCKAFNKDFTQNDVLKYFIPINPRKKRRKAWQA